MSNAQISEQVLDFFDALQAKSDTQDDYDEEDDNW